MAAGPYIQLLPGGELQLLVSDLALADDVGGTGEIQAVDAAAVALRIDHQLTAGHIHLYAVAGDLALQGQHGYHRAGAGAAGVGEILHAPLKGALVQTVFTGDLIEVHVGSLGKVLVPTLITAPR